MIHATYTAARRGFTMIELLVVITIIGVLAGLGIWAGSALFKQSDEAKHAAAAATIKSALEIYRADHDDYPEVDIGDGEGAKIVFGSVNNNRIAHSNVPILMELFGRDTSGNRQDDKKAYIEDTSMFYYYSGSGAPVKFNEAKSISSNGAIGFPITMGKTNSSKYSKLSEARAFAPIQITIDYDLNGHVSVSVPKEGDFPNVIEL